MRRGERSGPMPGDGKVGDKPRADVAGPADRLSALLANMTPDAMRAAFDWGDDVGREIVDD